MKAKYQTGNEALFNEADTSFGGTAYGPGNSQIIPSSRIHYLPLTAPTLVAVIRCFCCYVHCRAEALGDSSTNPFSEMAFVIDRQSVTARTHAQGRVHH